MAGTASAFGATPESTVLRVAVIGLQYRFGQLLDEQRNTVRALNDLRHHVRRQPFVCLQACLIDGGHLALAKPIEHHCSSLAPVRPKVERTQAGR